MLRRREACDRGDPRWESRSRKPCACSQVWWFPGSAAAAASATHGPADIGRVDRDVPVPVDQSKDACARHHGYPVGALALAAGALMRALRRWGMTGCMYHCRSRRIRKRTRRTRGPRDAAGVIEHGAGLLRGERDDAAQGAPRAAPREGGGGEGGRGMDEASRDIGAAETRWWWSVKTACPPASPSPGTPETQVRLWLRCSARGRHGRSVLAGGEGQGWHHRSRRHRQAAAYACARAGAQHRHLQP